MGMAASQARLLSITARLTNNENSGQSISYSKQRLADQTQQITNEYNEALDATKLTVLTGFNGAEANYTDISYSLMTNLQMAENSRQYVVTDTKGKVLVTKEIADAYKASNGNYNTFLGKLGYSQADISLNRTNEILDEYGYDVNPKTIAVKQQIHEAWDKYFATIGKTLGSFDHDLGFSWTETIKYGENDFNDANNFTIGDGYAGYLRGTDKIQAVELGTNGKPVNGNQEVDDITQATLQFDGDGKPKYMKIPVLDESGNYADGNLYEDLEGYDIVETYDNKKIAFKYATTNDYQILNSSNGYLNRFNYIDKDGFLCMYVLEGGAIGFRAANVLKNEDGNTFTGTNIDPVEALNTLINDDITSVTIRDGSGQVIDPEAANYPFGSAGGTFGIRISPALNDYTIKINDDGEEINLLKYLVENKLFTDFDSKYFVDDDINSMQFKTADDLYNAYATKNMKISKSTYKSSTYGIYYEYHNNSLVTYTDPINYEGTTAESRELYDYAMALTEAYLRVGTGENGVSFKQDYQNAGLKSASDVNNKSALQYYRNIFTRIQQSGYFTYTDTAAEAANDPEHYHYTDVKTGSKGTVVKNPLKDNYTFEAALRDGSLRLEYYSSTEKKFKSTTISEDNCIQEVPDERAIAKAETKYTQDMQDLENKDKKLDLELKKLDTEHKALETEYESVKNVVNKNVESTFKIFS